MIAKSFIRVAVLGKKCESWIVGTGVSIPCMGPPFGLPGLGSQRSIVAGPPAIHRMMTLFLVAKEPPGDANACRSERGTNDPPTASAADLRRSRRLSPIRSDMVGRL